MNNKSNFGNSNTSKEYNMHSPMFENPRKIIHEETKPKSATKRFSFDGKT